MELHNLFYGPLAKKINIFCLLVSLVAILVFPLRKEIWYDETVSVLCAKGISHNTPVHLAGRTTISSADLAALNTAGNVYEATVVDNGNSFIYNMGLHWFTMLAGNTLFSHALFSKLSSVACLIALFYLSSLLFRGSLFTALAILLLAFDVNFAQMSQEIRAYTLTTFFVTLAAIGFFKYRDDQKAGYLLLFGFSAACAILSHFLSVYIVLVFVGYILIRYWRTLLRPTAIFAVVVPLLLLALYFYFSLSGLRTMSRQNAVIEHHVGTFSLSVAFFRGLSIGAMDFKMVVVAFMQKPWLALVAFGSAVALYAIAIKDSLREERRHLTMLFLLTLSSTVFLGILCIKARHYTPLYNRYHTFCLPFGALFVATAIWLIYKRSVLLAGGIAAVVLLPFLTFYLLNIMRFSPVVAFSHTAVARQVVKDGVTRMTVPAWRDACLVNSFLPSGYKIDYLLTENAPYFTLYYTGGEKKMPVIKVY